MRGVFVSILFYELQLRYSFVSDAMGASKNFNLDRDWVI